MKVLFEKCSNKKIRPYTRFVIYLLPGSWLIGLSFSKLFYKEDRSNYKNVFQKSVSFNIPCFEFSLIRHLKIHK